MLHGTSVGFYFSSIQAMRYQFTKFVSFYDRCRTVWKLAILYGCVCNSSAAFRNDDAHKPGFYACGACHFLGHVSNPGPILPSFSSAKCLLHVSFLSATELVAHKFSMVIANWCPASNKGIKNIVFVFPTVRLLGPGVASASNRNDYQESFLGIKTASA
jgi:hypothetical protein